MNKVDKRLVEILEKFGNGLGYYNGKAQAISQIKALVIESLGEKKTNHSNCYIESWCGACNKDVSDEIDSKSYNQHRAEMKEKFK